MSVYVDNFLLVSNMMNVMQTQKDVLGRKYEIKNLGEVNTIIEWQITKDMSIYMIKID